MLWVLMMKTGKKWLPCFFDFFLIDLINEVLQYRQIGYDTWRLLFLVSFKQEHAQKHSLGEEASLDLHQQWVEGKRK